MPEIIEGRNPVMEAIRAGTRITRILLNYAVRDTSFGKDLLIAAKEKGIPVEIVPRATIDSASVTDHSQGVIAYAEAQRTFSLEELLEIPAKKQQPALFCILDGIEDPHNLGAIIRTADAAGFHGIIIREHRAAGITTTISRTSAGAIAYVPVASVVNISQTIEKLKKNNVWVIGVDMQGDREYQRIDYTVPIAIVIGGEGKGLSDLVRKKCDILARIPMAGHVNSLNASVAAALVMYAAFLSRFGSR